jgi:ribosomal protein S18 acetylase RimI-like enzyme
MMNEIKILETNLDNAHLYSMCGYKNPKKQGYTKKIEWNKAQFKRGMKYKILFSEEDGALGAIEYIPGEFCFRPVKASGYYFIHCIYIMKKAYKEQGYGQKLLDECIADAKKHDKAGVAVVVRKGTWMASRDLFVKNGFQVIEQAEPDFELMALKFEESSANPSFIHNKVEEKGLVIYYSDQCPYTSKAVNDIADIAKTLYGITPKLIELDSPEKAQASPCIFGTFGIAWSGKLIADHPVSSTRFKNIMNKILH